MCSVPMYSWLRARRLLFGQCHDSARRVGKLLVDHMTLPWELFPQNWFDGLRSFGPLNVIAVVLVAEWRNNNLTIR